MNGVPSDQTTPWRRCRVWVRPSALDSQRSASHGSSSKVDRLIRTSRPCISIATVSVVWSLGDEAIERSRLRAERRDDLPATLVGSFAGVDGRPDRDGDGADGSQPRHQTTATTKSDAHDEDAGKA